MKFIFFFFLITISTFAQCNFEIIDFKGSKINALPKELFLLKENQQALTGDYILFSLFTNGNDKILLTTFSRVARHQFPEFCYGEGAFIRFVFKDGSSVKLPYEKEELCVKQQDHPTRANFNALKIETEFKIPEVTIAKLSSQKIKSIIIQGLAGLSYTYEVEKKINDHQSGLITYPASYFVNKLPCLEIE